MTSSSNSSQSTGPVDECFEKNYLSCLDFTHNFKWTWDFCPLQLSDTGLGMNTLGKILMKNV